MKFIIGFILICLLANCGSNIERNKIVTDNKKIEYPITLDLGKGFDSDKWTNLESIIDSIAYIPLQTTNESWIRNIRKIIYYNNSFYIGDFPKLLQFSEKGEFIRQIGIRGRGPGEYVQMRDFIIQNDTIYINGRNKVLRFTTNGIYIDEHIMPLSLYFNRIGNTFITYDSDIGNLEFFNKSGQSTGAIQYEIKKPGQQPLFMVYEHENYFFESKDGICLNTFHYDTIHQITACNSITPRYILKMGKYNLPEKYRLEYSGGDRFLRISASYLRPVLIETENYVFIQYCTWGGECNYKPEGLYSNKINSIKTGVYIKNTDQFYLLSENNLTSSTPLFVPYFTDGRNHIISYIETFEALEYESNQTQNNKLLMAAKGRDETDNPILIWARLK